VASTFWSKCGIEQVCPSLEHRGRLWDRIVDTNLRGFFMAQVAGRVMKPAAHSHISSLTSERGIPTAVPMARQDRGSRHDAGARRRMAPLGIRVNRWSPAISAPVSPRYSTNPEWQKGCSPISHGPSANGGLTVRPFSSFTGAAYVTGVALPSAAGTLALI